MHLLARFLLISISIVFLLSACSQKESSSIDVSLEFQQLNSQVFNNTRTLRILLPPDYYSRGNDKKYKVLFMNDGQCLFNADTCGFSDNEWRIDETVDSLLKINETEPFIVVGIDNIGSAQRGDEYLPWEDIYLNPPIPNPMGSRYPDFLLNEVLPFIKSTYRISDNREDIGLGGASYGALISLYTYLENPGRIGFLLLESPSFYVNDQAVLTMLENFGGNLPNKVHLGIGTNELGLKDCGKFNEDNAMAVQDVRSVKETFISKGLNKNSVQVIVDECAIHNEKSYANRFSEAILFFLNK